MDWRMELAKRCETELEEIERLCGKCEDVLEWRTPEDARENWRNGPRHVFSLVIIFPNQFSFLRCLERECRKIDQLFAGFDDTGGSAPQLFKRRTKDADGLNEYDLAYFRGDHYRWSTKSKAWRQNPFAMANSTEDTEKARFVGYATGNFALLDCLQEGLKEFIEIWKEWGADSFDIIDGIKARIEALLFLKGEALKGEALKREALKGETPKRRHIVHPSIKGQ